MHIYFTAALALLVVVAGARTGSAQGSAPQPAGDPANGKAVFAFGNTSCTNCHGLEGQGGWGPDLAGKGITYDRAIMAIRNPIWRMPAADEGRIVRIGGGGLRS